MSNRSILLLVLLVLVLGLYAQVTLSDESFLDYLPETEFFSDNKQTKICNYGDYRSFFLKTSNCKI